MSRRRISGVIGIVVGIAWLAYNLKFFAQQGWIAIGMPIVILVLGITYVVGGKDVQ